MPFPTPGLPGQDSAMTATALPDFCAMGGHERRGAGALTVETVCGQSAATSVWASSPLKLLVPRPRGPSVWACLSSFGGGLVAGDETSLDLRIGPGAVCFLGTQASTKVYRNPSGIPCGYRLSATLGAGSLLVVAPDPVQAFAGSRYAQQQEFRLEPGASLVLVDWLSSGRAARGERWAFSHYRSRNDVFVSGERLLVDSLLLDPAQGSLEADIRMGRFNCLALVYLTGPKVADISGRWLEAVQSTPVPRRTSLVCSASLHRGGVLVRYAGESVETVAAQIYGHLKFLSNLLHDDPWARKW